MRPLFAALTAACLLTGCVSTNVAVLDPTVKYQKICPDGVEIFTSSERVTGDYREVALLHSKGESGWTDERGMMASQRGKAAALGANGIIFGDIKEPNAGTKIIGAVLGTGSERHGKAVAIYIPSDSDRVKRACGQAPPVPAYALASPPPSARSVSSSQDSRTSKPLPTPKSAPARDSSVAAPLTAAVAWRPVADAQGYAPSPPEEDTTGAGSRRPAETRTPPATRLSPGSSPERTYEDLMSDPALHGPLNDLRRQNIGTGCEQVEPGLLVLTLGAQATAPGTALAFFIGQLYTAYQQTVGSRSYTVVQLWYRGEQIGVYTSDGLSLRDLR